MNFENDIRRHVLTHLPHEVADTPTLAAKGIGDLLSIYFNWLHRLVPARPRQIHRSRSLLANPLAADPVHRQGLDQLIEKIENGTDIAPHLSRGILCGFKPKDPTKPKALLKRPDLDLLLNDWGIHHLHISTKLDKDGFVERRPSHPPRPLLFGIFRPDAAYLIDLMQHGDWTHTHLLEVAAREWPDAELVPELKGILPSSQPFSNEDRKPLRNAGISAPLERDGKVVAPIGFMSLAGTSIQTKSEVNRILGSLKRFLDQLTENPDYVADLLRQHGLPIPSNLDLHFMFFETGGYGVIEAQTSLAIRLDPPSPNLDKKARDQFRLRECFATLSLVRAVTSFVRS